jgi:hypothetical protein
MKRDVYRERKDGIVQYVFVRSLHMRGISMRISIYVCPVRLSEKLCKTHPGSHREWEKWEATREFGTMVGTMVGRIVRDQKKIGSRPACILAEADIHCNSSRYTIVQLDTTLRGWTWSDARSRSAWVKWHIMENNAANGLEG